MAYQILLVEDDLQVCEAVTEYFSHKSNDITFVAAHDGSQGLSLVYGNEFDLIILDVGLPEIDGYSICREIRTKSVVPILFLTARGSEEDILHGYALGCDDYMVKPFSLAELHAKVNALLRRSKGMVINKELTCGAITLNPTTFTVTANGKIINLAPKEYALLKYLLEHKNWAVDRDTLLNRVWGYDYIGGDRVVDNHIKKLRRALGQSGKQIKTVMKKGYKLTE